MEIQGNYILQLLKRQRDENIETVEASPEAEQAWREHVLGLAERTLLVKTNSWYMVKFGTDTPLVMRRLLTISQYVSPCSFAKDKR